jgi:dehydrogenase/reductase SDR family member 12
VSVAPLSRAVDLTLEATVVLSFSRIGCAVRSRLDGWRPVEDLPGTGRTVVVTGANSGLGYATTRSLLAAGAAVRMLVRSDEKGEDAAASLRREVGEDADVSHVVADLADLGTVRDAAVRLRRSGERIHGIVHNAGAMFDDRAETVDGHERTYQIHVVGPHLLTSSLLPELASAAPSRVVTVTSGGMYAQRLDVDDLESEDDYGPTRAYARAKRAQVALAAEWARRFGGHGIGFHAAHPGWALTPGVESSLPGFRRVMGPILRDPAEGADTITWLVLAERIGPEGRVWHDRRARSRHKVPWTVTGPAETDRLWGKVCEDAGVEPSVTRVS